MMFPMQRLLWPVQDLPRVAVAEGGLCWVDGVFHVLRCLGVPLVSVAAGFVAVRAMERKGIRAFLLERRKRLGVALIVGVVLILPVMYVVWAWGWTLRGWASWANVRDVRFGPAVQPNLYGLGHLWYLEYLLLYSILAAVWWNCGLQRLSQMVAKIAVQPVARLAIALAVLAPVLTLWPSSVVSFHNGFIPEPGQFIKHGLFFVWGMMLARAGGTEYATRWWVAEILLAGVGAWMLLVGMMHLHDNVWPVSPRWPRMPFVPDVKGFRWERYEVMAGAALLTVCGCFGMLGACERVAARTGAVVRWLAKASMTVYLTHLIPVGVSCVLWYKVDAPVAVKIGSGFLAGIGVPLIGRLAMLKVRGVLKQKKA